ncbi:hypothetical protein JCM33374_g5420 [Metschnikowia sp. JCM 33374]|nr:hypothetical protein JCM33374_g5420 [Metschnikowia sp. JCM 33374]
MPVSAVFWGCVAAIVSSAVQSLGITLQRKSHTIPYNHELSDNSVVNLRRESVVSMDRESSRNTHNYRRNLWLFGFLLFIVANVFGSLVQLTALPLIILSPLQSIGLIFNSVLSCTLLPGEKFTKKLAGGTIIIAFGAFVIAYNGANTLPPASDVGADERFRNVLDKFLKPGFLTWWCFTFFYMAILVRINWSISNRINDIQSKPYIRMRRSSRTGRDSTSRLVFTKGILYGLISGTLTAHTFLLAKSIVDVLVEMILERSTPKSSSTYVISVLLLLVTLCIVGMQLAAFNLGLSNISTSILYPLCFLVYNLVNLFNDLVFNSLLSSGGMSFGQLMYVLLGLSSVLYGVVLISWDSACGKSEIMAIDAQPLLVAKFPYDQKVGDCRVLSYEESEIMSQFSGISQNFGIGEA